MSGNYNNVQWLSVEQVAKLWAPKLDILEGVIVDEMRRALYKIERAKMGAMGIKEAMLQKLDHLPSEKDLPSKDTLIDRAFIENFCSKEDWALPEFWFKGLPTGPSFPGRPSIMSAIVQELEAIAREGKLRQTLAQQARDLESWARATFSGKQTPKALAIENGVRIAYRVLKKEFQPHEQRERERTRSERRQRAGRSP